MSLLHGTRARQLVSQLYHRRIHTFDKLNNNVDFVATIKCLFLGCPIFREREALYSYLNSNIVRNGCVDYLEFGVFQGSSLRAWSTLNSHPESRFFGFDSFLGLPESWTASKTAGTFSVDHIPRFDDVRVHLISGFFQNTLYSALNFLDGQRRLIVHIDSDLYSSALFCLTSLDRYMDIGSILIFDEFYDLEHEFRAYRDYIHAFRATYSGLAHTSDYVQVALVRTK